MRVVSVLVLLFSATAAGAEEEVHPALQEAKGRLVSVLEEFQPDAVVTLEDGRLLARYRTRTFLVHAPQKDGDHAVKPREVEGPDHRGFRLELSVVGPRFPELTAMVYPQTMREPYWSTHHALIPIEGGEGFLKLRLSYGSRCDRDLLDGLLESLEPGAKEPDRESRIVVYMNERYVEGRSIQLSLGLDPPHGRFPAELWPEEARLSVHVVRDEPTPEHVGLAPVLGRFFFPPTTRAPSRADPMDLTSEYWVVSGPREGDGRFRPKPGRYRLTVLVSVPDHRRATRLGPARSWRTWLESNTEEFEVVPAPEAKEDR